MTFGPCSVPTWREPSPYLVPDCLSLISQRDERYQRSDKGYCHTWRVKLAHWTPGSKVELRSAIKYGDGGAAGEKTEVVVKGP
jgi:hypothetical protein